MLLTLRPDHKKHVLFLMEQTPQGITNDIAYDFNYVEVLLISFLL